MAGRILSASETARLGLVALVVDPSRTDRRGLCTGTLIASRTVLTAGHCLANPLGALTTAVFGADAFASSAKRIAIVATRRAGTADLAFVSLADVPPAEWSVQIPLLTLAHGLTNAPAFGAGFGRASTDAPSSGGFARRGETRISSLEKGSPIATAVSGQGGGFCAGDSGGPLFIELPEGRRVAGVLSQGARTCESGLDTFTSVPFNARAF